MLCHISYAARRSVLAAWTVTIGRGQAQAMNCNRPIMDWPLAEGQLASLGPAPPFIFAHVQFIYHAVLVGPRWIQPLYIKCATPRDRPCNYKYTTTACLLLFLTGKTI